MVPVIVVATRVMIGGGVSAAVAVVLSICMLRLETDAPARPRIYNGLSY
jgi:hypothetical protein